MSSDDSIDVWYRHETSGGVFGFSLPLLPAIAAQVRAKVLTPCSPEGVPETSAPPAQVADLTGGTGLEDEDEPALYPCLDCGETAVKGSDGFYTEHCAQYTPKPAATGRGARKQA
jgi:N-methylhydantoinase B/oxoprolinase/acetone carboxylase alpha subunit